jgi:spermidine/putrescine-binding protein
MNPVDQMTALQTNHGKLHKPVVSIRFEGWISQQMSAQNGILQKSEFLSKTAEPNPNAGSKLIRCILLAILAVFLTGCKTKSSEITQKKQLNLYIWSAYVSTEILGKFHKETGIEVRYDTYDSNEAMMEKLQSGASDYDVVVPTNDIVNTLIQMNLLQTLNANLLPNRKNLNDRFKSPDFDPNNGHSIPFFWGTTGIAYNKTKVTEPVDSWSILWNQKYKGRILMLDDPSECFGSALKWKGYSLNDIDPAHLKVARDLLLEQKPLVKMYNNSNFDEILISGDVWLAQGWSGQIAKAVDQDQNLSYAIPKEGSAVWTDCLAIPKAAPHVVEAHAFLNYLLDAKIAAQITDLTGYATTNQAAKSYIKPRMLQDKIRYPDDRTLARCEWFLARGTTSQLLDRYWSEIKAR